MSRESAGTAILAGTLHRALEREQCGGVLDEYLTRFLQLSQTSLRLIRIGRVGIFFYDLPIKFRSVRLVVLLLFELRGIV